MIVKASAPPDILAMVPPMVGFLPRNSVVLLAFRGGRSCAAMRFDLPRVHTQAVHRRIANTLIGTVCKLSAVDALVLVIYSDDLFGSGCAIPQSDFAAVLWHRVEQSGFKLRAAICQAADGWASYFEPQVPRGGHPLDEIADSDAAAAIPDELKSSAQAIEYPLRVADADAADIARMNHQLESYRRLITGVAAGEFEEIPADLDLLWDLPRLAEAALEWSGLAVKRHGAILVFALQGPSARDLMMLQWATDITVGDQLWNMGVDSELQDHLGDLDIGKLMLGIGPQPDRHRIGVAIRLLLGLVSRCGDAERVPLLCMLTWFNWALGRGSQARRHLDELFAIDAQYSMAQLLQTMLGNGMLPEWVFEGPARRTL